MLYRQMHMLYSHAAKSQRGTNQARPTNTQKHGPESIKSNCCKARRVLFLIINIISIQDTRLVAFLSERHLLAHQELKIYWDSALLLAIFFGLLSQFCAHASDFVFHFVWVFAANSANDLG